MVQPVTGAAGVGFGAGSDGAAGLGTAAWVAGGAGASVDAAVPGGWNQLCRQLAQRTVRPAAPMAVSGTTYRVWQDGQARIMSGL